MIYTEVSEKDIKNWLKTNLNEERYVHSLGTAECAKSLAKEYGVNPDKAYIAGLLHDCAKCFPVKKLLSIAEHYLTILESEKENHKTLHAPVSAYIAKSVFKIEDEEILSAIRWHTLGRLNMSLFDKIIFLADKIELNTRTEDYCQDIRVSLNEENGLDKAILKCYKYTITSLVMRDLKICPLTIDIYNELQATVKR